MRDFPLDADIIRPNIVDLKKTQKGYAKCNPTRMQPVCTENVAEEFMRRMDAGLSERRLLEEIGELTCDELAAVLLMWYRDQASTVHAAN